MPDPSTIKIGAVIGTVTAILGLGWRVLRDLLSRIGNAHDHARQVAQTLRSEMAEQTRATRDEVQRVDADVRHLREHMVTRDDLRQELREHENRITQQLNQIQESQRRRDERVDRVAERPGGEGSR